MILISGLVLDLRTATLLAIWDGKASYAQQLAGCAAKNWKIEDNNRTQTAFNMVEKKIQTKLHSCQMDRMKTYAGLLSLVEGVFDVGNTPPRTFFALQNGRNLSQGSTSSMVHKKEESTQRSH